MGMSRTRPLDLSAARNGRRAGALTPPRHQQTLAEALVHPMRAGKDREARRLIAALEIAVDPVDESIAVAGAGLRVRHGSALRMPYALVIAYADIRKATRLLTADARWTSWSRRVELIRS
jgi:hypothetical protein